MKIREAAWLFVSLGSLWACSGEPADSGSGDDGGEGSSDDGGEGSSDDGGEGSSDDGGEEGGEDGGETSSVDIDNFSVTQCMGDTGSMPSGDDALTAAESNGMIDVEHLAVTGNCCPYGWNIGVTVDGSELLVWYDGDGDCDCECNYDLQYQITGVESGTWTVNAGGASVEVVVP